MTRTNFSEAYQALTHLKIVRLFVESVLRYGLPARYTGMIIKPDTKQSKRLLMTLSSHFAYLEPTSEKKAPKKSANAEEMAGEYANVMEQDYYGFPLFELPLV